ncbi:MAG TPA: hypothetical protein VME40_08545 [Caulobacteraceae bacterium]|nr:hypothetical protein [Caulobacteraceae bacterium]
MAHKVDSIAARVGLPMLLVLALSMIAGPAAAFSYYLDDELKEVAAQDRTAVANPQPVQVIFQITKNGAPVPSGKGYAILKDKVLDAVRASGVFSDVSDAPSAGGAVVTITLDSVSTPEEERDAGRRGYLSGLTLGLAPGSATDHYVWTVEFVASPSAPKITETAKESLTVAVGLVQHPPPNTVKMPTYHDAIFAMIRDVVSNTLNDLAKDPGFQSGAAPGK